MDENSQKPKSRSLPRPAAELKRLARELGVQEILLVEVLIHGFAELDRATRREWVGRYFRDGRPARRNFAGETGQVRKK